MCKVAQVPLQDSKGRLGQASSRESAKRVINLLLRRNCRGAVALKLRLAWTKPFLASPRGKR
jgi:hypothetical protein